VASLDPVQIGSMPGSVDEFVRMRDGIAGDPQGGAAAAVVALQLLAENKELGLQCLAAAVDASGLEDGGCQGLKLRSSNSRLAVSQILGNPHIPRSYFKGASPENGYELAGPPYQIEFSANKYSGDPGSGTYKLFVSCSGAASPRPVTVRKDGAGVWRALEWSSLLVGVQAPE
jgi:hypothetical protein